MGCEVVVAGADADAVADVFERWEETFSLFRPGSELCRVKASQAEVRVVSPLFASTLAIALVAAADTGGLVDPALGSPGDARLAGRLLRRPPGLALDLNGVVKALAVDEAA